MSYDWFHENSDRIYRVWIKGRISADNELSIASSPPPMAAALVNDYPEVEQATRLLKQWEEVLIRYEDKRFSEKLFYYADSTFFNVFSFRLIEGNPLTALTEPNSLVMTESTALKYFGSEDPMGKTITLEGETDFRVTGVCEDVPGNSHVHFDFLGSLATIDDSRNPYWLSNNYHTYIVLQKDFAAQKLEEKFSDMVRTYIGPQFKPLAGISFDEFLGSGGAYGFFLMPLTDIHFHSDLDYELESNSDIRYVYIFSVIAFFVLLLACINFMNLTTARSASRAKEVGVRKVVGSNRKHLIGQFLTESFIMSLTAVILAVILIHIFLPFFNTLSGKQLEIDFLNNPLLLFLLTGVIFFVGILAGSYPAFFLASFKPVSVLQGRLKTGAKSSPVRSGLVLFQFAVSIILFIGTSVVFNQLEYIRNKRLGFEKEQIITIKRAKALGNRDNAFKNELSKNSSVLSATLSSTVPGMLFYNTTFLYEGAQEEEGLPMWFLSADYDFLKTMRMEIAEGRYFSRDISTDHSSIILTETAARALGWKNPIGKRLRVPAPPPQEPLNLSVVGVLKDFHFETLHREIRPLVIMLQEGSSPFLGLASCISIRTRPEKIPETIEFLKTTWKNFVPEQPFEYFFLDENFDNLYRAEQRTGDLFRTFSILAIIIACLGLFGLASFSAEQRMKEIGIRKVLGASIPGIFVLLSREFTKWVIIANIVAWPVAYFVMRNWLQSFAYRTDISIWVFILSAVTAFAIALVTVSYQALKSAVANPVDSLKYE